MCVCFLIFSIMRVFLLKLSLDLSLENKKQEITAMIQTLQYTTCNIHIFISMHIKLCVTKILASVLMWIWCMFIKVLSGIDTLTAMLLIFLYKSFAPAYQQSSSSPAAFRALLPSSYLSFLFLMGKCVVLLVLF